MLNQQWYEKNTFTLTCLYVCFCAWGVMNVPHACSLVEARAQLLEVSSLLSPWGSQELNAGHWAWQQAPLLAEPSPQTWWKCWKGRLLCGFWPDSVRSSTLSEPWFSHLVANLSSEFLVSVCTTTKLVSKCHYLIACEWQIKKICFLLYYDTIKFIIINLSHLLNLS